MFGLLRSRKKNQEVEPQPRSRWGRKLLLFLLFVLAFLWFAPIIVSRTDLRHWVVEKATKDLQGTVHVGECHLSWFANPVIKDVVVRDLKGKTVLSIPEVQTSRTLLQLVLDNTRIGLLRILRPEVHVVYTGEKTNIEEMLAKYLEDDSSKSTSLDLTVELVQAKVTVEDTQTAQKWILDPVDSVVEVPENATDPLHLKLAGKIRPENVAPKPNETPSAFLAEVHVQTRTAEDGKTLYQAKGQTSLKAFPLVVVEPVLRLVDAKAQLAGTLDGDFAWEMQSSAQGLKQLRAKGKATGKDLLVESAWLEGDRVVLQQLDLACNISTQDDLLQIEEAKITCDVGTASLAWTIDLRRPKMLGLGRSGQTLKADLDVAKLAQMLPHALRLQDGTRVTSGKVHVDAGSQLRADGILWSAKMNATDLRWSRAKRDYAWNEPIALDVSLVQKPEGLPIIERGVCDAGFLTATASGTAQHINVEANADLDQLTSRLEQLVDLKDWRATGQAKLRFSIVEKEDTKYRVWSQLDVNGLRLPTSAGRVWQEDKVTVNLDVIGQLVQERIALDTGKLYVHVNGNTADLTLAKPVTDLLSGIYDEVNVVVVGDLKELHQRAKNWTTATDDWKLAGRVELEGRLQADTEQVTFDRCQAKLWNADLDAVGLSVQEPNLLLNLAGRWYRKDGKTELRNSELIAAETKLHLAQLVASTDAKGALQVTGSGTLQGELARVYRWVSDPDPLLADGMHGQCQGTFAFYPADGRIGLKTDLQVRNFVYGLPTDPTWNESNLHVIGTGRYETQADLLWLDQLRVVTDLVTCEGKGKLEQATTTMNLVLNGHADYDVKRLEPYVRPYLGNDVLLQGQGRGPLHLTGMLSPPGGKSMWTSLAGTTSLHWDTVSAMGVTLAGAKVNLELKEGWLLTQPIETTVSQGKVRLLPSFRIDPDPMMGVLAKGTSVDHFQLTPELASGAMKYALPVMSEVVQAKGQMSLQIDDARIPIDNPKLATVTGRFLVHDATVGANPVIRELTRLFNVPSSVELTKESVVSFLMKEGWVYHENLSMVVSGVPIRTSGWVGLDGRISMMADLPMPTKLLGNRPLNATLAKQRIQIPLRGTLSQPKLDEKALSEAVAKVAREMAVDEARRRIEEPVRKVEEKIREGLDKKLEGLFRPRP